MNAETSNLQLIKDLEKRVSRLEDRKDLPANSWPVIAEDYVGVRLETDSLLRLISDYFKVEISDIRSKIRRGDIVNARKFFCYFAKGKSRMGTVENVGLNVGLTHGAVCYHANKLADLADVDKDVKRDILEIKKVIDKMY